MGTIKTILSLVLLLIGYTESVFSMPDTPSLFVGYADVDITPPLGVTMPGYFHIRHATGVLDPLRVKTLTIGLGETTLVVAAFDLIGIDSATVKEIREEIQRQTGIAPEYVFIHGTHTHTGATLAEIKDRLPRQAAEAVKEALNQRIQESTVTLGTGQENTVAFIRRYLMKDGSVRTNPGRTNTEVVRPIGRIDPTVTVITFSSAKTMLVSYGLHLDCIGGEKFSADYPYHLTQAVKESLGEEWNVIYLNACCGNVNHINVNNPAQRSGYEESQRIGRTLAQVALAAHKNARPIAIDRLASRTAIVDSPARPVPQDLLDWARQQMRENAVQASTRQFNEETPAKIVERAEAQNTPIPAEIIAMRIGPVGIVGLPVEAFQEVGADIKARSLLDPTLTIGITGGYMGYLPHPRGYDEGGYEATFGSARFERETSELWSDTAARLIREMAQP